MDRLKMQTPNLTDENIKKIAQLFPNVITEIEDGTTKDTCLRVSHRQAEGHEKKKYKKAVDFDLLKQMLSDTLAEGDDERYRLDWPGKKASLLKANTPINKTLRPVVEDSVDFEKTENLFIDGDNFEVLKILQESYLGKIKMIYIDPPYNTGNDFIYKDDFKQSNGEYEEEIGAVDEEGGKLFKNTDSNGRFHSDWLSMMYERLIIARDLLKDDGVIFISIDYNEFHNLRKICDEVFGEENFITNFCWEKKKKPSFLNKNLGTKFEYISVYAKHRENTDAFSVELTTEGKKYPFNNAGNGITTLTFPTGSVIFNIEDGFIDAQDMSEGRIKTELLKGFSIKDGINEESFQLKGEWRYSQKKLDEIARLGEEIIISKIPFRPNHVKKGGEIKKMHNLLTINDYSIATNEDADSEQTELFGLSYFDYTKPTGLLKLLIKAFLYNSKDEIILDFFAGSATTSHSVMQMQKIMAIVNLLWCSYLKKLMKVQKHIKLDIKL